MPTFSPEPSDGGTADDGVRGEPRKFPTGHQPDAASPNLKRRIVPTYKGRPVRADLWHGQRRFYDDAAVFVTGIPLEEPEHRIRERFSKHGKVIGIEYEKRPTFREARVMYEDNAGARNAMLYEVGCSCSSLASWLTRQDGASVSGVSIRVRDRRIPAQFIEVRTDVLSISDRRQCRSSWMTVGACSSPPRFHTATPHPTIISSLRTRRRPRPRTAQLCRMRLHTTPKTRTTSMSRSRVRLLRSRGRMPARFQRTWFVLAP